MKEVGCLLDSVGLEKLQWAYNNCHSLSSLAYITPKLYNPLHLGVSA